MNQKIAERWVRVSHQFGYDASVHFLHYIQGIGRLDAFLSQEEYRVASLTATERATEPEMLAFDRLTMISRLWVLDCFEITRSLYSQLSKLKQEKHTAFLKELNQFKGDLMILRAPLSKFEKRNKPSEPLIAWPISTPDGQIGWTIDNVGFVTRRSLAQRMLAVLEAYDAPRHTETEKQQPS
jgi:hypothetical protein